MAKRYMLRLVGLVPCLVALLNVVLAVPASGQSTGRLDASVDLGSDEFVIEAEVFRVDLGRRVTIHAVPLSIDRGRVALEVERFRVFAEDATIVVHEIDGVRLHPVPRNLYFRGRVVGEDDSIVVMTRLEGGLVRGLVSMAGRHWVFSGDSINKALPSAIRVREIEPAAELEHDAQGFQCGAERLAIPPREVFENNIDTRDAGFQKAATYTARIAVESDHEFYAKFGNATDATNYVADIIAYGSTIYSTEAATSWLLQHLSLWSTAADPWDETNPDCGLYEFGRYWNDERSAIVRTTAAFFSGKTINAGIAWTGVLCYGSFLVNLGGACPSLTPTIDNYGGEYAYIGGMDGNFDISNPAVVWDMVAVAHEIGHNFNSPHTHCYARVGGNANQIDQCYGVEINSDYSCYSGAPSLPSGCPGPGNGCGTIMSYCHLLSGGLSNMSLTLGQGHPYGVAPERVPAHMNAHVSTQAASNPGCLDYVLPGAIFADGFESGDTTAWSSAAP